LPVATGGGVRRGQVVRLEVVRDHTTTPREVRLRTFCESGVDRIGGMSSGEVA
jgi:hypothetical protein